MFARLLIALANVLVALGLAAVLNASVFPLLAGMFMGLYLLNAGRGLKVSLEQTA